MTTRRSPSAAALSNPLYRQRKVPMATRYQRRSKHIGTTKPSKED